MLNIELFYEHKNQELLLRALDKLGPFKPIYFTADEKKFKNKKEQKVSNTKLFEKFQKENPCGYFLYGHDCEYDISSYTNGFLELDAYTKSDKFCPSIKNFFQEISSTGPFFGFVAQEKEQEHRNYFSDRIHTFVGRRPTKYVPGLYWYTLLSSEIVDKFHIDLDRLISETHRYEVFGPNKDLHLLQFFEDSKDWKKHKDRLDLLCEEMEGIFTIKEFLARTQGITKTMELIEVLGEWD